MTAILFAGKLRDELYNDLNGPRVAAGAGHFPVVDRLTAPPGSCADGANYIVTATATGAWAGKENQIATAVGVNASTAWYYHVPVEGVTAYVQDENARYLFNGSAWGIEVVGTGDMLAANNLSDLASATTARSNLGVYSTGEVDSAIAAAVIGLLDFKGTTDCSSNPNYPAASKGDAYVVSVAGKIGGASGTSVKIGDWFVALADNAGGTEASVGSSWGHLEHNLSESSTTDVLTGTDAVKEVTPDALAALWEQGSDVASTGTISLGEGGYFNVTGTTTITDIDFATDKAGRKAWVKFAGALTLTHNASTLILPTGANITTTAGDTACFVSEGSDVVRCVAYQRASGAPLVSGPGTGSGAWALAASWTYSTNVTQVDFTNLGSYSDLFVIVKGIVFAVSGTAQMRLSVDNGANFLSGASDYVSTNAGGAEAGQSSFGLWSGNSTAARTGGFQLFGANVNGINKPMVINNFAATALFVGSTAPVNAIRIFPNSGGNITGGSILVFGR